MGVQCATGQPKTCKGLNNLTAATSSSLYVNSYAESSMQLAQEAFKEMQYNLQERYEANSYE